MNKYLIIRILPVFLFLFLFSCKKETKGFDLEKLVKPEDLGEYHKLDKDNIEVYLPQGFRELSIEETKAFIDSIKEEKIRFYYQKNLEQRKFIKGNFYIFYGEDYTTEVLIQTLPYMPFSKQNAKELLYLLRKEQEKYQEVTGIYHDKITSTYTGDRSLQLFKAKYRLNYFLKEKDIEDDYEMFSTIFLITSNHKTFLIRVISPFDNDFTPFIKKIKL